MRAKDKTPLPMRARLLFAPALAAAVVARPARAYDFLTVAQARDITFPKAKFTDMKFDLTDGEIQYIQRNALDAAIWRRRVPVWKVSTGGWFFLDQCVGRDDVITFSVGLDNDGAVKGVEVLVCLGVYDQIRKPEWISKFVGCKRGGVDPAERVPVISGVSLSSQHLIEAVRRVMAVHQVMIARKIA